MTSTTCHSELLHEPALQEHSDKAVSKKHSHENWQRLISEWEHSGLSQKVFCEQQNIKLHTFVYHRNRMLQEPIAQAKV